MPVPKPKYPIELTTEEEHELRKLANSRKAAHVKVVRARILLAAYDHPEWSNRQVAEKRNLTDFFRLFFAPQSSDDHDLTIFQEQRGCRLSRVDHGDTLIALGHGNDLERLASVLSGE